VPPCSWRVDLRSDRSFHPERLLELLDRLGGGRHRSRGCFWLPTRPGDVLAWDGAGGQLSIGRSRPWGRQPRHTRIVLHGVGTPPDHLEAAFDDILLLPTDPGPWTAATDGFEAWLGPIHHAA
jgi:G3E family GTPase